MDSWPRVTVAQSNLQGKADGPKKKAAMRVVWMLDFALRKLPLAGGGQSPSVCRRADAGNQKPQARISEARRARVAGCLAVKGERDVWGRGAEQTRERDDKPEGTKRGCERGCEGNVCCKGIKVKNEKKKGTERGGEEADSILLVRPSLTCSLGWLALYDGGVGLHCTCTALHCTATATAQACSLASTRRWCLLNEGVAADGCDLSSQSCGKISSGQG